MCLSYLKYINNQNHCANFNKAAQVMNLPSVAGALDQNLFGEWNGYFLLFILLKIRSKNLDMLLYDFKIHVHPSSVSITKQFIFIFTKPSYYTFACRTRAMTKHTKLRWIKCRVEFNSKFYVFNNDFIE